MYLLLHSFICFLCQSNHKISNPPMRFMTLSVYEWEENYLF